MWVGKGLAEFEGAAAAKTKQYKTEIWNNNKYNKNQQQKLLRVLSQEFSGSWHAKVLSGIISKQYLEIMLISACYLYIK